MAGGGGWAQTAPRLSFLAGGVRVRCGRGRQRSRGRGPQRALWVGVGVGPHCHRGPSNSPGPGAWTLAGLAPLPRSATAKPTLGGHAPLG